MIVALDYNDTALRLQALRRSMQRDPECPHRQGVWVRVSIAGGNYQVRRQCLDCGHVEGESRPHRPNDHYLPWADEGLRKLCIARQEKARDRHRAAAEEWRRLYAVYLDSAEWHDRRDLIMERCDGTCEGCGQDEATEVHHLTYDHVGEEFLFELTALCRDCHRRWHHIPADDDEAES